MSKPVLVTGASGFVGRRLTDALRASGRDVRAAYRSPRPATPGVHSVQVGGLGPDTDWTEALQGVDSVVHLAARVHVMNDKVLDPLAEFRRVNVEGTLTLARQATALLACGDLFLWLHQGQWRIYIAREAVYCR